MQNLRKILFYLFTVTYVVLCPVVIMYALGYIMTPGQTDQIVQTGVIYVSTAPKGAEIYVGEEDGSTKTPDLVQGLVPGDYEILLKLEGYLDWNSSVPVEAGKATTLDTILLVPEKRETEVVDNTPCLDIEGIRKADKITAFMSESISGLFIYDCSQNNGEVLAKASFSITGLHVENIFSSEESNYILVQAKGENEEKYFWIDLSDTAIEPLDVSDLFRNTPDDVKWEAGSDDTLFVLSESAIDKINIKERAVYPAIIKDVRGYGLSSGKVYLVGTDNRFFVTDNDGNNARVIIDEPAITNIVFRGKGEIDIDILGQDIMVFRDTSGIVTSNRLPYTIVDFGARGVDLNEASLRLLVWQKGKIGIVDFSEEKTGRTEFERGPLLTWVYSGKDVNDACWAYEASHVVFRDGSNIKLLEILEYGKVLVSDVAKARDKSAIYYSENTGKVYYVGRDTNALSAAVIVPSKSFIPANSDIQHFQKLKTGEE